MKSLHSIVLIASLALSAPAIAGSVGKIIAVKGDGNIIRANTEIAAQLGASVHANDTLRTLQEGIITVQFLDKSSVTVGSNSEVTIDRFVFDANRNMLDDATLAVGKGFFQFVGSSLSREKTKIKTPVSTIGIRGTELFGEVKDDGSTWVGLVKCCIDFSSDVGDTPLNRPGTYSEIVAADKDPSSPILAPQHWVQNASVALGMSEEALGFQQPEESTDSPSGWFNRQSFPFIND